MRIVEKEDADLYLSKVLYPVLLMGLEELAAQIEKMQTEVDPRVKSRFNACAYLAEYLMRNNPKFNPEKTKDLTDLYAHYAEKEKIERTLMARKSLLRSLFVRASAGNKDFLGQAKAFIASLDHDLGFKGKLTKCVDVSELIGKESNTFEEFLAKWVESLKDQKEIRSEELEKALEVKYPLSKK